MAIILDHQLREYIPHNATKFPITYFHDELVALPDWTGLLHWHPDFEIADIAKAADISRSEAGRCFHTYMNCSPVDALIQHRLQMAHQLLSEKTQTLQQISYACGFNSVNYFSRQYKKKYGYSPGQSNKLGK